MKLIQALWYARGGRWILSAVLLIPLAVAGAAAPKEATPADLANMDKPAEADAVEADIARWGAELKQQPSAPGYVRRGIAYFKLRQLDEAIDDFNAALKLNDRHDDAYFARGMALARNGDIEGGIADLGVYITRHPNSSLAYTKRGVRHLWNGDFAAAEKDLSRAIKLDPRNAEAHDDLGVIYAKREDYREAARHFATTIDIEPRYQKAHHNLALVRYLMNDNEAALAAVNRSLALGADRDSLLLKAVVLEDMGRSAEARAAKAQAELIPEGHWSERQALD